MVGGRVKVVREGARAVGGCGRWERVSTSLELEWRGRLPVGLQLNLPIGREYRVTCYDPNQTYVIRRVSV